MGFAGGPQTKGNAITYAVAAFEVDDVFPRRREDRPNVYIGRAARDNMSTYIEKVESGHAGPRDIRGRVRRHVPELTDWHRPRATPGGAKKLRHKVARKLHNRGYRGIVGGPDVAIYVIELDPSQAMHRVTRAWLYAGSTGKAVRERYDEHLAGHGSRVTKGRCLMLRGDLAPTTRVRPTLRIDTEARIAEALLARGYDVHTDAAARGRRTRPRAMPVPQLDRRLASPLDADE